MRKIVFAALATGALTACDPAATPALGAQRFEVTGVEEGDMLKLRAGPGTGYSIRAGLPNGTVVRVKDCSRVGGTRWCEVAMDRSSGMTGYVSQTYLQAI